jgi:hypothetical protein
MPDASTTPTNPPFRRLVVFVPLTGDGKAVSGESPDPSLASSPAP